MLTTQRLVNIHKDEVKRSIKLNTIKAVTLNKSSGSVEFVVHVKDEYDYRFSAQMRDEILFNLKSCIFHLFNKNLPVFGVSKDIDKYMTNKSQNETMPPPEFRMHDEDLYEAGLEKQYAVD